MNITFIPFNATDNVTLPGLLYQPSKPTKKATIWLHGMGDNAIFYKPQLINALGKAHCEQGIAFLAFNNRGAHNRKRLKIADDTLPEEDRSYQGGTYYELIEDAPKDIDGAVQFLKDQGYTELYLAGHSSGTNKICVYDAQSKKNPFSKYILAGPGDDTGLFFKSLGEKKYWEALKHAGKLLHEQPLHTMPKYTGMYPFSAQSAWDILNPDGGYNTFPYYEHTTERLGTKSLFKEYQAITVPTLVIIGDNDEFIAPKAALDTFLHYTSSKMIKQHDFELVKGGDHTFHDQEAVFAKQIVDWITK